MCVYIYMYIYIYIYIYINVCVYACKRASMHGWMDGWMNGWMDGWMDGCMYVCMHIYTYFSSMYVWLDGMRLRACVHACMHELKSSILRVQEAGVRVQLPCFPIPTPYIPTICEARNAYSYRILFLNPKCERRQAFRNSTPKF